MDDSKDDDFHYGLQWNNHTKLLKGTINLFRNDNELVDVTLSCEGKKLKAHKIILSACSAYFLDLFKDNPCQHPIVILRDIKYQVMVDILTFMYVGEVNVAVENLNVFFQTAELLEVKGLIEDSSAENLLKPDESSTNSESVVAEKNCSNNENRKTVDESVPEEIQTRAKNTSEDNYVNAQTENYVSKQEEIKMDVIDFEDLTNDSDEFEDTDNRTREDNSIAQQYSTIRDEGLFF